MEMNLLPGTVCIAAISQLASSNGVSSTEELCYEKDDILTVISHNETSCIVRNVEGLTGEVPLTALVVRPAVQLLPMLWFHCVTREEAEKLLDVSCEGQFLVRPSQSSTDSVYALAVCSGGVVKHYLIAMNIVTHQLTIDGKQYYDTLPGLIKYYQEQSTTLPLSQPLASQESLKYYVDKKSLQNYWGLCNDDFNLVKSVGHGEFGEVHAGTYRGLQVAIKSIPEDKEDGLAVQGFLQEAAIMTHLRHKNLVQLVGVVFKDLSLNKIVLEFMAKGSLGKYLATRGRTVVAQTELLSYSRDICEAMVYISSQGFIHRDLAARNVLLNGNGQAKISDFGLAIRADSHVAHEKGKFPVKWTAPEALKENMFSEKSDVWSFGICLWEIYSYGRVPYPSILAENVLEQLEDGFVMDPPDGCPNGIYNIMTLCWQFDSVDRPTFENLQVMLSKSFGESRTPCSSPLPDRRAMVKVNERVEELLQLPLTSKIYQEAPLKNSASLYIANLIVVGPKGAGKTSLIRCFNGNEFRHREPPTSTFDVPEKYCELVSHRGWLPSTHGLAYDNELCRTIIDELLKQSDSLPPPLPPNRMRSSSVHLRVPPPLPPRSRPQRMSLLVESQSHPPLRSSGSIPEDLHSVATGASQKTKKSIKKRFSKLIRRGSLTPRTHHQNNHSSPPLIQTDTFVPSSPSPPLSPTETPFVSAIPDTILDKLKEKLKDCVNGTLPPEIYGKLIDIPSHKCSSFFTSLLLTESSVMLAVVDISFNDQDIVKELLNNLNCIFDQTATFPTSLVLVGTHSDKHTSAVIAKQRLDEVRQALKNSCYSICLASSSFIVSCSSLFDQSTIEDLKKYIIDIIKKKCHLNVPLRWLRCIRRFQNLSEKFFIPLADAKSIIKEVCLSSSDEEVNKILKFLHNHLVILHHSSFKPLLHTVITNPHWFLRKIGLLYSLADQHNIPPNLTSDHQIVLSHGVVTDQLLEHLWSGSKSNRQELLLILHSLELIALCGPQSRLLSPWESEKSLLVSPIHSPSPPPPTPPIITSIIVPSLVQEPLPESISLPLIDPLYFLSHQGYFPTVVFNRLLVRCLRFYTSSNVLYKSAACFLVDPMTMLLIEKQDDKLKISLHPSHHPTPSSSSLSESSTSSCLPAPETAMSVLMFIQPAITDIFHQWLPNVTFDLRIQCYCNPQSLHYIILEGIDTPVEPLECELGSKVTLPLLATPWFGEDIQQPVISVQEDIGEDEFVNTDDIQLITEALQDSWSTLGNAIGVTAEEIEEIKVASSDEDTDQRVVELFSTHLQSSSFLDLVSNLENVGRSDIADILIDSRMKTSGIAL